ncbi:hypothetical protein [Massilia genomosp. 1]|uniref:Uncharacterized protein n=1 Tax=Massilia genomosp. 1 TaxID=2609280 RepID=A0ABX0MJW4_9BURK|nr:hypothetical protein [Massilia genomosp. 1]NHZ62322.1 hypothetical protein [Massilia genomosp. 1]
MIHPLATFRPRALMPPKIIWMRVNRLLAWALIVSPLAQIALGTPFMRGLALDLVILLAHGALSLALFGMPKSATRRFNVALHVFGRKTRDLSPRNTFLLSGHRLGLTFLLGLLLFGLPLLPRSVLDAVVPVLIALFAWIVPGAALVFWPLLRVPLTLVQHLHPAIDLALRRWGMRSNAQDLAVMVVVVFFFVSFINLIR